MVVPLVTTRSIFGFGRRAVAGFKSLSAKATKDSKTPKESYAQWISNHIIAHSELLLFLCSNVCSLTVRSL